MTGLQQIRHQASVDVPGHCTRSPCTTGGTARRCHGPPPWDKAAARPLYAHFGSKDGLFGAIFFSSLERW